MARFHVRALLAGAGLLVVAASAGAGAPAKDAYDAAYVGMKVPEKVVADAVFRVAVTMKNTGTQSWGSWPLRLRTINPPNNMTWGTNYILVAQGRTVKPGEQYTFSSDIRAPSTPGEVRFQWQVCHGGKTWFGQTTPARTIKVTARPAEAAAETRPAPGRDGRKVLAFVDFEYAGSFKPPMTVGKARGAFSQTGLALRKMPHGPDRLFVNYTHPARVLFEIDVPALVKVDRGKHAPLKTADVVKVWGALSASRDGTTIGPNGGFVWDEAKRTLYWAWYHGYKTGPAPPVLGASKLAADGTVTSHGPWFVSAGSGLYKSYWGGVIRLPEAFAQKYTGGKTLALGFGGYYSICGSASRGPALGAIPEPDPKAKTVPVTEMLHATSASPAPRDGDYFSANCGYWHDRPSSRSAGKWTFDDHCRAGVFIDAPAGHAYIAFPRLGTGRLGYDFGAITSAGASQYWYFYDPADLGAAAKGQAKPAAIAPTSMTKLAYPLGSTVTGACYDPAGRLLYLCVRGAYTSGREHYPVIHVYRLR